MFHVKHLLDRVSVVLDIGRVGNVVRCGDDSPNDALLREK